jgi:hypothetical protein
LNGQRHRENGPAIERVNGNREYYLDGKRHRKDGPAIEYENGNKYYYLNDQRHRADGPAVIEGKHSEVWVNGVKKSEITEF